MLTLKPSSDPHTVKEINNNYEKRQYGKDEVSVEEV